MSTNITAKQVNELRQKTGSGMMDCKKALVESNGDFDKAIDILRKKGQKVSASRSDRKTSEGVVVYRLNDENSKDLYFLLLVKLILLQKNEDFLNLSNAIIDISRDMDATSLDQILSFELNGQSVEQSIVDLVGKIGEKIEISDYKVLSGEKIVPYIHAGNKLGVLVSLKNVANLDYTSIGKDVAMQIASMNPIALDSDGVDQSIIEKEIEIGKEQALKEGKPEQIVEKIAQGKLQKFFKDNTLLNQQFVKDNSLTIKNYLSSFSSDLTIESFIRISIG